MPADVVELEELEKPRFISPPSAIPRVKNQSNPAKTPTPIVVPDLLNSDTSFIVVVELFELNVT